MKHCYTQHIYNKRVALLGPMPPPFGGVSVHVQRVIALLKKQYNSVLHIETCVEYRYRFFIGYLIKLAWKFFLFKPHEVHLHTLYLSNGLRELQWLVRLQGLLHYKIILIEHDCRYLYHRSDQWKQSLKKILPHITQHIFIGNLTEKSYRNHNLCIAQKISIESAFLPPDEAEEQSVISSYPQELFQFIQSHSPLLLANAFQLSLFDGKDLYGFDQCIDALRQLKAAYKNIGFIFVVGQIGDRHYYHHLLQDIKRNGLTDHCFMLVGQRPLWPLLKKIDLFVRPTLSDGASVSIEEALWCGKPVVASNVCVRPQPVILYDVKDTAALSYVIHSVLYSRSSGSFDTIFFKNHSG